MARAGGGEGSNVHAGTASEEVNDAKEHAFRVDDVGLLQRGVLHALHTTAES